MIIGNDFYLHGFIRQDKGEAGAVFVRYAAPTEAEGKPEIRETSLLYGGKGTHNYTLSIPLPSAPKIVACAVVTRSSKKRYQAVVYDEQRIESFSMETLGGLRKAVEEFFYAKKSV